MMKNLASEFTRLKLMVGGNREKRRYEETFGMPESEAAYITPPSRSNVRILSELEYALKVSEANGGEGADVLEKALDLLLQFAQKEGSLTDSVCREAEEILSPMAPLCKSYTLILTGHAHIDMNWMWSFRETVAATLATFRSVCNIMDEYPDFTFTQSQGSVYRIVEMYDPELMERMKKYIDEGRWEVAASSWVEPDKNMPSGESLLRHIEYTRSYLREVWGVKDFDLDFVPDTFGHAVTIPEIDSFGGVRYMYHCRGTDSTDVLYRYQAPSGNEILVLREANWYNAAVTPQMAAGLMEVVKRSSGLKYGMCVYGVGDHGGGPTRRDVERAIDMMSWPIYPTIEFGGLRKYFAQAEKVRDKVPVARDELNYFAQGCYTTQSRIKRGNRRAEAAFYDTEALAALAEEKTGFQLSHQQMEDAWRDVLFTHFHDILTGSCVRDSREHAMGLFQTSACVTDTQSEKAMAYISKNIDTESMPVLASVHDWEKPGAVRYSTQSEGAGAGYGVENFSGVPAAERGSGLLRIFHVFNTLPEEREGVCMLTVWDYTGDISRVHIQDPEGNELPYQIVDEELQKYWDHRYFRILVGLTLPALGYGTIVLRQREQAHYPTFLRTGSSTSRPYDDIVLDNGIIRAVIDAGSGRVKSLRDLKSGSEMIAGTAGLALLETEPLTSSAWHIGRTIRQIPVDRCVELTSCCGGPLRQSAKAVYLIEGWCRVPSRAEVTYSLDAGSRSLQADLEIDWQEQGGDTIPVLAWQTPLARTNGKFRYIIPAGTAERGVINNDVPGIGGAAALRGDGLALALTSDSKYGYRGQEGRLDLTLINSSVNPDPYPERGIHNISLRLGVMQESARQLQRLAFLHDHGFIYQPGNAHPGTLAPADGLLCLESGEAAVTAIRRNRAGKLVIRGYETAGKDGEAVIRMNRPVRAAFMTTLADDKKRAPLKTDGAGIIIPLKKNAIFQIVIE